MYIGNMYYTDITLTLPGGAQRQLLLRRPVQSGPRAWHGRPSGAA